MQSRGAVKWGSMKGGAMKGGFHERGCVMKRGAVKGGLNEGRAVKGGLNEGGAVKGGAVPWKVGAMREPLSWSTSGRYASYWNAFLLHRQRIAGDKSVDHTPTGPLSCSITNLFTQKDQPIA